MKNLIIIFGVLCFFSKGYSQKDPPSSAAEYKYTQYTQKNLLEVEKRIEKFIEENKSQYKLTPAREQEIRTFLTVESEKVPFSKFQELTMNTVLDIEKDIQLRKLYLSENPEDERIFKSSSVIRSTNNIRYTCDNGGFEEGITDDYVFSRRIYNPSQNLDITCSFNTQVQFIPTVPSTVVNANSLTIHSTLTSNASEPLLASHGINVPMAYSGDRAIRLNNQFTPSSEGGTNRNQATKMEKYFVANSSEVTFSFNFICQNPSGHPPSKQPRFIARLYDSSNNVLDEFCLVADVNNGAMFKIAHNNPSEPLIYTDWQCVSLSTKDIMKFTDIEKRRVRLEIMVNDCTLGGHYGMVYVDDICTDNCDSIYGNLQLEFENENLGNCPSFPIEICGNFKAPQSINTNPTVYGNLQLLELRVIQGTNVVSTISTPSYISNNGMDQINYFCFTLDESHFGNPPLTEEYEFEIYAEFTIGGMVFPITKTSVISGPDVSFTDCDCKETFCCPEHRTVIDDVYNGVNDIRQAEQTMIVQNTIHSGGYAYYSAGYSILLAPSFYAMSGSRARLFIDYCSRENNMVSNTSNFLENTDDDVIHLEPINFDNLNFNSIVLYPNPLSENIFYIKFPSQLDEQIIVTIYDTNFKKLAITIHSLKGDTIAIENNSLISGVYIIEVKSKERKEILRLMKK